MSLRDTRHFRKCYVPVQFQLNCLVKLFCTCRGVDVLMIIGRNECITTHVRMKGVMSKMFLGYLFPSVKSEVFDCLLKLRVIPINHILGYERFSKKKNNTYSHLSNLLLGFSNHLNLLRRSVQTKSTHRFYNSLCCTRRVCLTRLMRFHHIEFVSLECVRKCLCRRIDHGLKHDDGFSHIRSNHCVCLIVGFQNRTCDCVCVCVCVSVTKRKVIYVISTYVPSSPCLHPSYPSQTEFAPPSRTPRSAMLHLDE